MRQSQLNVRKARGGFGITSRTYVFDTSRPRPPANLKNGCN